MKILFLHGWYSVPGGVKPTYLKEHGHTVINPALDDDDFDAAVRTAQAEFDKHHPEIVVGSSRGGAVAMNMDSGSARLVLLCPAWRTWGVAKTVKPGTVILHCRADDTIPFSDSEELTRNSGLPATALIEVGSDHRLADPEPLAAMLAACGGPCVPEWTDSEEELLEQDFEELCYTAAVRWIGATKDRDWSVVHGTVLSLAAGKRIEHAWCERGETVVDLAMPVGSRIIEWETYYQVLQPVAAKVYSADDALFLSVKNRRQGPWDESEQLRK